LSEFIQGEGMKRAVAILFVLTVSGCDTTSSKRQITFAESSKHQIVFAELSSEEQLKYAQGQLFREKMRLRRAMNAFLHFMNDNQAKWVFRLPDDVSVSVVDEKHFSGAKPYSQIVCIGSILAIDRQQKTRATMTFHGFVLLENAHLGWWACTSGWWKAEIHGEEVTRGSTEKDTSELDELVENLNDAMGSFFATHFGRIDGVFGEHIKDHILHNPLFF